MRIPSPRGFIEIIAFTLFAVFVAVGMVVAVALLLLIRGAEAIYDGLKSLRRRRA